MKKFLSFFFFLLLIPSLGEAQNTTLTGTVVDPDGQAWIGGTWKIAFQPNSSIPNINAYNINGVPLVPSVMNQSGSLDGTGSFSVTVYQSLVITPALSSW